MFFSLQPAASILADRNSELVGAYTAIRDDWRSVTRCLRAHQRNHSDEYYYKVRSSKPRTSHTKAGRFLYLNRTCWNGLYRVNLRGEFNVPRGTKNSVVLDTDNFEKTACLLRNSELLDSDFEETLELAESGDFAFIDPPYTVKHNLNGFLKYNEKIFSWSDQKRLKKAIERAVARGVMVTVSNADHQSIHELYGNLCDIEIAERNSVLAGSSKHRRKTSEVIMKIGWG